MLHPTTVVVVAINPCMRAGTTRRIYILDMCAADCLSYILPGFLFVLFCFFLPLGTFPGLERKIDRILVHSSPSTNVKVGEGGGGGERERVGGDICRCST